MTVTFKVARLWKQSQGQPRSSCRIVAALSARLVWEVVKEWQSIKEVITSTHLYSQLKVSKLRSCESYSSHHCIEWRYRMNDSCEAVKSHWSHDRLLEDVQDILSCELANEVAIASLYRKKTSYEWQLQRCNMNRRYTFNRLISKDWRCSLTKN